MKRFNFIWLLLITSFIVMGFASAKVGDIQANRINNCIDIVQQDSETATNIITFIYRPDGLKEIKNANMTASGNGQFSYPYCMNMTGTYTFNGIGNYSGSDWTWKYQNGGFNLQQTIISVLFILITLCLTYYSFKLFNTHKLSEDNLDNQESYKLKKAHEFMFYMKILQKKLWILGLFGIYLSIFLFSGLSFQILYNYNVTEFASLFQYLNIILGWGFIPFILFWMGYMIIIFWKGTTQAMKYQFGAIGGNK